uniref:(northern house mosquito) hypothetical protein n=1 Tax=Culex pipiens TaxID=7175 RepID=A0A8D8FX84_CULPI
MPTLAIPTKHSKPAWPHTKLPSRFTASSVECFLRIRPIWVPSPQSVLYLGALSMASITNAKDWAAMLNHGLSSIRSCQDRLPWSPRADAAGAGPTIVDLPPAKDRPPFR